MKTVPGGVIPIPAILAIPQDHDVPAPPTGPRTCDRGLITPVRGATAGAPKATDHDTEARPRLASAALALGASATRRTDSTRAFVQCEQAAVSNLSSPIEVSTWPLCASTLPAHDVGSCLLGHATPCAPQYTRALLSVQASHRRSHRENTMHRQRDVLIAASPAPQSYPPACLRALRIIVPGPYVPSDPKELDLLQAVVGYFPKNLYE